MSLISTTVNNEVLDWKYKKIRENHYRFVLGEEVLGDVFRVSGK